MATKSTRTTRKVKTATPEENGFAETETTNNDESGTSEKTNSEPNEKRRSNQVQMTATLDLAGLKDMSISELTTVAKDLGIEGATGLRKQE